MDSHERHIPRRSFLRSAVGTGLGLSYGATLLSACAPSTAEPKPAESKPSQGGPAAPGGQVVLRIARPTGPGMAPDPMIQERFNAYGQANPRVKLEYEPIPFGEYFQKLGLAFSGKQAADVSMVNEVWAYVEAGHLAPAPKEFADDVRQNFGKAAVPPENSGQIWGYPLEGGLRLVVYNKDHFREAGIAEPTASAGAEDWDQLLDWARRLTKIQSGEITREGWKVNQPGFHIAVVEWFWMLGGELCSGDCTEWKLDQPAWKEAVQWWADTALKHKAANPKLGPDAFAKGLASMVVDGPFTVGQLRQFSQVNFGVFLNPPKSKGGQSFHDDGPWMYTVNKAALPGAQEEAWKFLRWLTNDENGVQFAKSNISIYRQSAQQAAMLQVDPIGRVFLAASSKYVHPRTPKYWRIWVTRTVPALEKVFLGQLSVDEMAKTVEKQINDDIKSGGGRL